MGQCLASKRCPEQTNWDVISITFVRRRDLDFLFSFIRQEWHRMTQLMEQWRSKLTDPTRLSIIGLGHKRTGLENHWNVRGKLSEFRRVCFLFGEKSIQCRSGDTEDLGSPALVAPRFFQGFDNINRVEFWLAVRWGIKHGGIKLKRWRQVLGLNFSPLAFC